MTEDPWTSQVEAFGRFVTGQRRLAQRRLRELSARRTFAERLLVAAQPVLDKKA